MVDKQRLQKLLEFKKNENLAVFNETLKTNDALDKITQRQADSEAKEVEFETGLLNKQDEIIQELQVISQKEDPTPTEFPSEIKISNPVSIDPIIEKIDGVITAINNKENKEVELKPLVDLLTEIKDKKYPILSTSGLEKSLDALAVEIKTDRLVDKKEEGNPKLEKNFEELIKKIEALIKVSGSNKKSIIGGWGSDTVSITSSALPTGAATETTLAGILTALGGGAYQTIIAAHSSISTTTYVGVAASGTATSDALWKIQRLDSASGLIVKNAGGVVTYTNIWDNREALSYS